MSVAAIDVRAQRLALAQEVLGRAEEKMARSASSPAQPRDDALQVQGFPVPAPLAQIMPERGLRPGSSVGIAGACRTSVALSLAGAAMGEESWCALVGMPHVGIGVLGDLGIDPSRTVLVPTPGAHAGAALSALVDGIDVVVMGEDMELPPTLWRSVTARARTQGSLLVRMASTSGDERSDLKISSRHVAWGGLACGSGRIRFRRVHLTSAGRAVAPGQAGIDVRLPTVTGMLASVAPAPATVHSLPTRGVAPVAAVDHVVPRGPALTLVPAPDASPVPAPTPAPAPLTLVRGK